MADGARSPGLSRAWLRPANVARALSILLPLAVLGVYAHAHWVAPTPSHAGASYDPEMAYLLNSLAPLKSRPYMYYHHPGTPLSLLGTLVLFGWKALSGLASESFIEVVLRDPSVFFAFAHGLLALAAAATVFLLFHTSRYGNTWSGLLISSGTAVAYFSVYAPVSFDLVTTWNQNFFAFPAGALLLLLLLRRLQSGAPLDRLHLMGWGGATGLLWSVQYYFVAWVVGVAVAVAVYQWLTYSRWLKVVEALVWSGLGGIVGFGLAFLPILHRGREFAWWMRGLLIGGGGGSNALTILTDPAAIGRGLAAMWSGRLLLLIFLLVGVGLVLASIPYRRPAAAYADWWAMGVGTTATLLLVHMAVLAAALVKRPAPAYMLPLAALLPLLLLLGRPLYRKWSRGGVLAGTIGVIVLVLFASALGRSAARFRAAADAAEESAHAIDAELRTWARPNKDGQDLTILWAYGSPSHCYGLRFGNIYTERAFRSEVNSICPDEWSYDSWSDQITTDAGTSSFEGNEAWHVLIGPEQYLPANYAELGTTVERSDIGLVFVFREGGR